jgi:hypothetical protein
MRQPTSTAFPPHLEHVGDLWYVYRGLIRLTRGYRFKSIAERELACKQQEKHRLLVCKDGTYHPQWRWNKQCPWVHFGRYVGNSNEYAIFRSLIQARRFFAEHCIDHYEIVHKGVLV